MKIMGEWRSVDVYSFKMKFAESVCKLMDCGSPITVRRRRQDSREDVWGLYSSCDGSNLTECRKYLMTEMDFTEITCSESIRLVNGDNQCSGRLEVKSNTSWSIVCEDDFDQQDAEVVCRELDCGAPSGLQGALYGETEAPEWSRDFLCEGHESALLKCRSSQLTRWTCPPGKAVEITCSDPDQVMLVGGASRCSGELHLKHHQEWRPVQLHHRWSPESFQVVCHRLNCGSFVSESYKRDRGKKPVWWIETDCMKNMSLWRECVEVDDSSSSAQINITCSESIRLVNGDNRCSGRLEVKSNNSWSIVCEDDFDQQDAEVVCRELGCGAPSVLQGAVYGETEAPEWSREFLCEGHESALLHCKSSSSSQKFCSSGKAVELTCSVSLRLVGTTSRCAGVLEMFYSKEWRPVYDYKSEENWNHESATAVCSRLDCGSSVFQEVTDNSTRRDVWRIESSCWKSLSDHCVFGYDYNYYSEDRLEVSCSDSLESPNISVSSSSGVSKARNQGLQVFFGTSFSIICSSHHLYQGGIFQLIFNNSTTTLNNTLPAVNNSALFSFLEASHAHQGDYICVHHVHINSQNLTLQSQQLSLTVLGI
uniref:SRCR domain-containing protein n=1 Tax=Oryzias melastigma TaxID=30732 RepID=A0A3B3D9R3_ORYME